MALLLAVLVPPAARAVEAMKATVYKDPDCGCCTEYVTYLRGQGFNVTAVDTKELSQIKQKYGVPKSLEGCHTMVVGGYVVEGLVPVTVLKRLLSEKPAIKGISLPGMPQGSPGMTGRKAEPFKIYELLDGPSKVYAVE